MNRRTVAIEGGLGPFRERLKQQGYRIVSLDDSDLSGVDAVIVGGSDDNLAGRQDIITKAPIIDVSGMTPEEVERELDQRLHC